MKAFIMEQMQSKSHGLKEVVFQEGILIFKQEMQHEKILN